MINYEQIMKDLPVQNFIKSNFRRMKTTYTNKSSTVECHIYNLLITFYLGDKMLYLLMGKKPILKYYDALCINTGWSINLNEIQSDADLFALHVKDNLFRLDYKFCEYLKELNTQVFKEFFPWKTH